MALDYKVVGTRIKNARKIKEITQEQLSDMMGISVAYLSRVERGSSTINLKRLTEISEKLDIPINYFLNGSMESSKTYLDEDFAKILKKCTPKKQRMIFEVAKIISESNI